MMATKTIQEVTFVGSTVERIVHYREGFAIALLEIIDGKIKDKENDHLLLPCPPYCDKKPIGDFRTQLNGSLPLLRWSVEEFHQSNYDDSAEEWAEFNKRVHGTIKVKVVYNDEEYHAMVGLNEQGKVMQAAEDPVFILDFPAETTQNSSD